MIKVVGASEQEEKLLVLGPSQLFGEPSLVELFDKASRTELSRAKLFSFKTEPNRAFGFPKLSYFWLFWVDFFKEYNFLVKKYTFIDVFRIIP